MSKSSDVVRLQLLEIAHRILINRNIEVITTEKVVEEARKMEDFINQLPPPKPKKKTAAEFLTESDTPPAHHQV